MALQVTGKNVEAGGAFQEYITEKIANVLGKYIGPEIGGHVRLEKERTGFRTDCSIRLRTGLLLETHGAGDDAYASADAAVDRLEKRVRRYKRRLKNHHNVRGDQGNDPARFVRDFVVEVDGSEDTEKSTGDHPVIIAEHQIDLHDLSVSDAVMRLDLTDNPFLLFRNAANGNINVVYRRMDGNIGWIDPDLDSVQLNKDGTGGNGSIRK